jgi:hypothetical protein
MKGYLLFLSGNSSYGQWAKNMVNSLAHFSPEIPIAIVGDINLLPERERKHVAHAVQINPADLNDATGRIAPGKFKLHLDKYTPFDETMYIDCDGVAIQELHSLWERCLGFDFATQVVSQTDLTNDSWPCLWLTLDKVREEFELPETGVLPEINSSILYWKNTPKAAEVWANAKANYKEHLATKHWGHSFPDELAFNVALCQANVNPDLGIAPVQFKAKTPDFTELKRNHYFVGCYGQYSTEARKTYDLYDRVVAHVEKQMYGSVTAAKAHHLMKAKFAVSKPVRNIEKPDVRKIHFDAIEAKLQPELELIPYHSAAIKPFTNAFNGTLVGNLYATRLDKFPWFKDRKIAVWDWNGGKPTNGRIVPFVTENGHAEDPCGVMLKDRPAIMFNDGYKMYFGYLDDGSSCLMQPPASRPADFDGREKNWSPFVYEDKLHVLYAPGHVVEYDWDKPVKEYKTEPPTLTRYHLRGGTQLVEHKGKLYTIFHVQQKVNGANLYWAGLLEMEAKPPFKALRWSRTPLWKATYENQNTIPANPHTWQNPLACYVTYPRHLEIDKKGNCLILAGHHDCTDAVIRLPLKEMLKHIE